MSPSARPEFFVTGGRHQAETLPLIAVNAQTAGGAQRAQPERG